MKKLTPALAILALALAGCATQAETGAQAEAPTPETTTQETQQPITDWEFNFNGAAGTFTAPTERPDNEWANNIIDYRKDAGLDTNVYWTVIEADNTEGHDTLNITNLTFITEDGEQIDGTPAEDLIDEAQDVDNTDQYNEGVDLYNNSPDQLYPGAKGQFVLTFPHEVEATHAYIEDTTAYPAGEDGRDHMFREALAESESLNLFDNEDEQQLIDTAKTMCDTIDSNPDFEAGLTQALDDAEAEGYTQEQASVLYGAADYAYCN